jgi:hypothetical protein
MVLATTGPVSLRDIAFEFGVPASQKCNLGAFRPGGAWVFDPQNLNGIAATGPLSLASFRGAATAAPTGLRVTSNTLGAISIAWDATPLTTVTGYVVSLAGGASYPTVVAPATTTTITSAAAGQTLGLTIRSVNANGVQSRSSVPPLTVTAAGITLPAMTGLVRSNPTTTGATLGWTAAPVRGSALVGYTVIVLVGGSTGSKTYGPYAPTSTSVVLSDPDTLVMEGTYQWTVTAAYADGGATVPASSGTAAAFTTLLQPPSSVSLSALGVIGRTVVWTSAGLAASHLVTVFDGSNLQATVGGGVSSFAATDAFLGSSGGVSMVTVTAMGAAGTPASSRTLVLNPQPASLRLMLSSSISTAATASWHVDPGNSLRINSSWGGSPLPCVLSFAGAYTGANGPYCGMMVSQAGHPYQGQYLHHSGWVMHCSPLSANNYDFAFRPQFDAAKNGYRFLNPFPIPTGSFLANMNGTYVGIADGVMQSFTAGTDVVYLSKWTG